MKTQMFFTTTNLVSQLTKLAPISKLFHRKNNEKVSGQNLKLLCKAKEFLGSACLKNSVKLDPHIRMKTMHKMTTLVKLAKVSSVFKPISQTKLSKQCGTATKT